jgi:hypothetical protein
VTTTPSRARIKYWGQGLHWDDRLGRVPLFCRLTGLGDDVEQDRREDDDAGTVLSLAIDGFRHLQITARSVPAPGPQFVGPAQVVAVALDHRAFRASKTSVREDDRGKP